MEKENLLVIFGTGGTKDIEMPMTEGLTKDILNLGPKIIKSPCLFLNDECAIYNKGDLRTVNEYIFNALKSLYKDNPNFEHLVDTLEMILSVLSTADFPNDAMKVSLKKFINFNEYSSPFLDTMILNSAISNIYEKILNVVYEKQKGIEFSGQNKWFYDFLQTLNNNFTLKIVTLNYDTIIKTSIIDNLKTGFDIDEGEFYRFNQKEFFNNICNDSILLNLHGCINLGSMPADYTEKHPNIVKREREQFAEDLVYYKEPKKAIEANSYGRSLPRNQQGFQINVGPIITGLNKMDQLLYIPYQYYYNSLYHLIRHSNKLLIIGYGFQDLHINNWLVRITRIHNEERKILIITSKPEDYNVHNNSTSQTREAICIQDLSCTPDFFENRKNHVKKLKENADNTCAIWFEGFESFVRDEERLKEGLRFLGLKAK